jgi:hypothetical protein
MEQVEGEKRGSRRRTREFWFAGICIGADFRAVPTLGGYRNNQRSARIFPCKRTKKTGPIGSRHNILLLLDHPFAAFAFAHRARCAAAILFRAATDILRFLRIATTLDMFPFALAFAHRAFCAAAILARPAAESLRVLPLRLNAAPKAESAALMPFSSRVKRSCSFFRVWTTPASLVI